MKALIRLLVVLVATTAFAQAVPPRSGGGSTFNGGTVDNATTFLATGEFQAGLLSTSTDEGSLLVGTSSATSNWLVTFHNTGSSHRGLYIDVQANERALAMNTNTGIFFDGADGAVRLYYDGNGSMQLSHSLTTTGTLYSSGGAGVTENIVFGTTPTYNGLLGTGVSKTNVTYQSFIDAGLTSDIKPISLPARTRILAIYADTTDAFGGAALTGTIQMQIGTSAGGSQLIVAHDVKSSAVTKGLLAADMGTAMKMSGDAQLGTVTSWSAQDIWVRLTSGSGNFGDGATTNLTGGNMVLYVVYQRLP